MKTIVTATVALLALTGCATNFYGSAHIEGGRAACEQKCAGQGMALSGMVYMGEYSSACVCEVPGRATASRNTMNGATAAVAGGAAAVQTQSNNNSNDSSNAVVYAN